jgi:5-methylcytosine-specific restriction endonuclease McrA
MAANAPGYDAAYRTANRDAILARHARWRAANRHRQQVYSANKRAEKAGATGRLSQEDWLAVLDACDRTCICGAPVARLDHVVPLGLGGQNVVANVQALCVECDAAKTKAEASTFGRMARGIPKKK